MRHTAKFAVFLLRHSVSPGDELVDSVLVTNVNENDTLVATPPDEPPANCQFRCCPHGREHTCGQSPIPPLGHLEGGIFDHGCLGLFEVPSRSM